MKKVCQPKNLRLFNKNYIIVYFFLITPKNDDITCFFFFLIYTITFFPGFFFPIYITTPSFGKETHRFINFLTEGFSYKASTIIHMKKVCQPKNLRLFKKKKIMSLFTSF